MSTMLNEREAAQKLNVTVIVMQRWRRAGKGPKYIKYGTSQQSRVRYSQAEIEAFQAACTIDPKGA